MNVYGKAVLYGAFAGTAWMGAFATFEFLAWKDRLQQRTPVVVWARDLEPGARVTDADVRTRAVDPDVLAGTALGRVEEAVGRELRCPARAGELALRGCLARTAR